MDNTIDLSGSCRTCLRSSSLLTSITAEDTDNVKYNNKLKSCIGNIDWTRMNMPSLICDICIEQLRVSYNFRNTCINTDQTLQKYFKQLQNNKIVEKLDIVFNEKYECVDGDSAAGNITNLPDEDSSSSEYLHLKHFLDSEEDLSKQENQISTSNTPEAAEEHYINNFNQSQTIEIEVQDIQEIIIQAKSEEVEQQNHLINNGGEYSIQEFDGNSTNSAETQNSNMHNTNFEVNDRVNNKIHKINDIQIHNEKILGSDQIITCPSRKFQTVKSTKSTGVQVRPPTSEGKPAPKSSENTNTCSICGNTYRKRANLKVHMRSHTGEKPFECKYCEKRFHHSSHLKEHIRRHTGEKPFHCQLCPKKFTIRGELTMHMKSHTGEKPFACNICDRRCLTASDLKIHTRTHTGEKPYACENCGKNFSSSYILSSHMKIHTGERPFPCKLCDKSFTQSSHLNVHMKKHTGEKFTCKFCPATFSHSSQLTVHKREHTGKQPYKCEICGKSCNYASELQSHMVKHTGQKFSCKICEKQFSTASYLSEHTRVHTGQNLYPCTACDRTFTRQQYLEKHIRTHTGEKPYSCLVCGKTFSQSSSLKVHTRVHTGERPFNCNHCEKTFITSSDLASHVKKHQKYIDL